MKQTEHPLSESTADIVKRVDKKTGEVEWKVLVTNQDGKQYLSHESWATYAEAYQKLRQHLRALGVPDHVITEHVVN